jgi:putative glycosyltransferase (TIGR04372 family)
MIDRIRDLKRRGKFPLVFKVIQTYLLLFFNFRKAILLLIYASSVTMRLPWSRAYLWMGERYRTKLFQIIDSDDYDKNIADKIYLKGVGFLERACQLRPNFVVAAQLMGGMGVLTGRTDKWLEAQHRVIDYQEKRAQNAGVDSHNFRILNAGPIFSTIGNTLTLDAWIKSGILGLRPPWRSLIPVEPGLKGRAANQCLLDYWKKYYDFVEDPTELSRLKPLIDDLRIPHDYYIPCGEKIAPYTHSAAVWIQSEWEKQGRQPLLQLEDEHRQRGWDMLERMGVPRNSWFVTSHVRENGFKSKESFRDSAIATYFDSYREVTSRGGWVIRLGDASMKPLPPMPQVIDYALSPAKCDWMDVFLLGAARFMIGTSSGPTTVSYTFGVPVAMTNNLPSAATYLGRQDIFLPRLMRRIDDNSLLNLEELMTLPHSMASWDTIFTNVLGVDVIPNSSEEITDLVKEMLTKLDGPLSYSEEEEALQQRFKSLTAEREAMIGFPGFEIQCRLGASFLDKYQHLLGYTEAKVRRKNKT